MEEMDVLLGTFCHVVSNLEVLSASPCLLNLMDIRGHEPAENAISLKVWEKSWDPSWS